MDNTEADVTAPPRPKQAQSTWRWLIETIVLIAIAFAFAQGIKVFVVQPFVVPTGSMEPTIAIGNYLLAEKISYRFARSPQYGDVVVFNDPNGAYPVLVKRVIAVGGQTVDIKNNSVYVDGKKLDEPYTHGQPSVLEPGITVSMPLTVPDGKLWVMGDNRTNSADSRYFGTISVTQVQARAIWTYWPLSQFGKLQ
ncbi:MAG: signal peptidase I [Coriobacteriia bacterium]|nr:signal peptidase I [Coriobacteriia bacterium]